MARHCRSPLKLMETKAWFPLCMDVTGSPLSAALQAETSLWSLRSRLSRLRAGHSDPPSASAPTQAGPQAQAPPPAHTRSITLTVLVSPHHTHTCTPARHSSGGSAQKLLSKWMISNTQSFPKANLPKTTSFTQTADRLVSILVDTHTHLQLSVLTTKAICMDAGGEHLEGAGGNSGSGIRRTVDGP